jgi:hypothetical protein
VERRLRSAPLGSAVDLLVRTPHLSAPVPPPGRDGYWFFTTRGRMTVPIHVQIHCPGSLNEPNPEIKVNGDGLESQGQLATLLLTIVERITGISTDSYVALVNEARKAAARDQAATDNRPNAAEVQP